MKKDNSWPANPQKYVTNEVVFSKGRIMWIASLLVLISICFFVYLFLLRDAITSSDQLIGFIGMLAILFGAWNTFFLRIWFNPQFILFFNNKILFLYAYGRHKVTNTNKIKKFELKIPWNLVVSNSEEPPSYLLIIHLENKQIRIGRISHKVKKIIESRGGKIQYQFKE